jgi:charged multivesicular body protein 6
VRIRSHWAVPEWTTVDLCQFLTFLTCVLLSSRTLPPSALLALKRKRYQETLLSRTSAQMLNLEDLVHHIQFASMQSQVLEALKQGNQVLNQLNEQTKLEEVEKLMEDTREAVEYQNEVAQLMGAELNAEDERDIENTIKEWEEQVSREEHREI